MKKSPLTSSQIDNLKWIAILTMVIDHTPKILGIEGLPYDICNAIGRITFPCFAFLIAHNYHFYSKNPQKYIQRLFIWGVIAQPIYMYAFDKQVLNILFMLSAGLALQAAIDNYQKSQTKQHTTALVFTFILAFCIGLLGSYGVMGVLLIPVFCLWLQKQDTSTFIVAAMITLAANNFLGNAVIGLTVFLLLFYLPKVNILPRLPGWFFYLFYPLHLAILAGINYLQ